MMQTDIRCSEKGVNDIIPIVFWFDGDSKSCGNAYRAIERLYEMNCIQTDLGAKPV